MAHTLSLSRTRLFPAQRPYGRKSNKAVKDFVASSGRLELVKGTNPQVYGLMTICWQADPAQRPRAALVAMKLAELLPYTQ